MAAFYGDVIKYHVHKDDGTLGAGWKLNTYDAGTTTPKSTFTDIEGTIQNSNPVVFDGRGEATILFDGNYKLVLTDENDIVKWTQDNFKAELNAGTGASGNLIVNGSFETDTDGNGLPDSWVTTVGGVTAIDTAKSFHGANSMKFTNSGSGGGDIISESFFEVSEGRDIPVSFALESSVANVRNIVEIFWFDAAQAATSTTKTTVYDDAVANPTSFAYKWFMITPPSGARYAKIKFQGATASGATGTTWFDDVVANGVDSNDKTVAGNLTVSGNSTTTGTSTLTGNTTVGGTLAVTGVITAPAGVSGNATSVSTGTASFTPVAVTNIAAAGAGTYRFISDNAAYQLSAFTITGIATTAAAATFTELDTSVFGASPMVEGGCGVIDTGAGMDLVNITTAGTKLRFSWYSSSTATGQTLRCFVYWAAV